MAKSAIDTDVLIIGGGLAGLTLAKQLREARNDLSVTIMERNQHPLPLAAHKVGESSVEIGAHYFSDTVGLKDYLADKHLRKFGLRFFFGDHQDQIEKADEIGGSSLFGVPSYQLDRGLLENDLARFASESGAQFFDNTKVQSVDKPNGHYAAKYRNGSSEGTIKARWVIDAASRASVLKRGMGLKKPNDHAVNAVWFRVAERVKIDDWSDDQDWHDRCAPYERWLSTNHLMGPGYWVWLIPLGPGATSIGIVADPRLHPLEEINTLEKSLAWLDKRHPKCAQAVRDGDVLDFKFLKHFSHDSERVFSSEQWGLTGEAGVFLDPFYSPGSDFIGLSNTMLTDLVTRDFGGENITVRSQVLERVYYSLYRGTLDIYQDQYPGFGDSRLMVLKTTWDYAYYWGIQAQLFFQNLITDIHLLAELGPELENAQKLSMRLQQTFREYGAQAIQRPCRGVFFDQQKIPCMPRLNIELLDKLDRDQMKQRIRENIEFLEELAVRLEALLDPESSEPDSYEREHLGDLRERLTA